MAFSEQQFKDRTKAVGLRIIQLVESLPASRGSRVLGDQLLRSGTSIGANYRAACRAVSVADIISKLGDVEEETDESMYWIDARRIRNCTAATIGSIAPRTRRDTGNDRRFHQDTASQQSKIESRQIKPTSIQNLKSKIQNWS